MDPLELRLFSYLTGPISAPDLQIGAITNDAEDIEQMQYAALCYLCYPVDMTEHPQDTLLPIEFYATSTTSPYAFKVPIEMHPQDVFTIALNALVLNGAFTDMRKQRHALIDVEIVNDRGAHARERAVFPWEELRQLGLKRRYSDE